MIIVVYAIFLCNVAGMPCYQAHPPIFSTKAECQAELVHLFSGRNEFMCLNRRVEVWSNG
jgi:hypothetical protein